MSGLVLLSGGIDSATLLADALQQEDWVKVISFDYGQRHRTSELNAGRALASYYGIERYVVDLTNLQYHFPGSALTDPLVKVPHGHYAEDTMKATVVPNRNAILLNVAVGVAVARHFDHVYAGMHAGDHPVYPDCRPAFIDAMNQLIPIATERDIQIIAPFIEMSKDEIAKRGFELNVPFGLTYSCYEGDQLHCGRCGTCVERQEAFDLAGVKDPTEYKDKQYYLHLKEEGRVGNTG